MTTKTPVIFAIKPDASILYCTFFRKISFAMTILKFVPLILTGSAPTVHGWDYQWNGRGSEHTINGERFPMDMHLFHQASSLE